mmetsp:Transcript_5892/g.6857  ORF Transcript_5892/g.6857 Transcript_5892/m.6857 type:complete len:109 (-) Transcript_5892:411-737(-)|eukprot:CAMPEP_0198253068 /NCGR_PEP_ID=MMETSP1447-20131203/3526_1 /TAXON_ID=420782 /ORGANISM="Chaetoceros dichaeta, Strain CCMP1751" /LENGTH=108 /DNA_ID=CAMNT_0043938567 /DNA_START=43 /DNA_END=369 /DNA_ORIENTATION=-
MKLESTMVFLFAPSVISAFTASIKTINSNRLPSHLVLSTQTKLWSNSYAIFDDTDKAKCKICPDPEDNPTLDKLESTFAMMGTLWSSGALPDNIMPTGIVGSEATNGV